MEAFCLTPGSRVTSLLIDRMNNHPKDRHVLAAAVKWGTSVIVTYNKRDFPASATEPWGVEIHGPSAFLKYQYDLNPSAVIDKLRAQTQCGPDPDPAACRVEEGRAFVCQRHLPRPRLRRRGVTRAVV